MVRFTPSVLNLFNGQVMKYKWSDIKEPDGIESFYTHITLETPIGKFKVEWKSWKEYSGFSIFCGDDYLTEGADIEDSKEIVHKYLLDKAEELKTFIEND